MKLTGQIAIEYAQDNDLTLNKYADPTEDAREGLTVGEAKEVAREDASLIWCETLPGTVVCSECEHPVAAKFAGQIDGAWVCDMCRAEAQ